VGPGRPEGESGGNYASVARVVRTKVAVWLTILEFFSVVTDGTHADRETMDRTGSFAPAPALWRGVGGSRTDRNRGRRNLRGPGEQPPRRDGTVLDPTGRSRGWRSVRGDRAGPGAAPDRQPRSYASAGVVRLPGG